jgi:glycosyltransferase involved in cell wall biosynthesis
MPAGLRQRRQAAPPPLDSAAGRRLNASAVRILAVTPFPPDPAGLHGGAVYLGAYLQALGTRADLTVACLARPSEATAAGAGTGQTAFRLAAATHAQLGDLRGIARLAHRARMLSGWSWRGLPLLAAKYRSPQLVDVLGRLRREQPFDVALIEMAVMAQYLPLFDGLPTVLADHERGPVEPAAIGPLRLGRPRDARLWRRYVRRLYPRAALLQAVTAEDAAALAALLGRAVEVRPVVVPLPAHAVRPDASPPRALFLGNYLHLPNAEAARRLALDIWPLVRQRSGEPAELWLAGAGPPPLLGEAAGVRWRGAVARLDELLAQVRVLVAPVFSGGGARVKVLTAMAHGLPVIGNALGLRGIDAGPMAATRAESPAELAAAIAAALRDPAAAARAGRAARAWAAQHASPDRLAEHQLDRLRELIAGHRHAPS